MVTVFDGAAAPPCNFDVDVTCCDGWDTYDPELQTNASEYGAYVMWAATGRRYGTCTRVARPCGRSCNMTSNGFYWSEGAWLPYILDGVWRNCWCGCNGSFGCCTCSATCQVYLNGPVYSVSAVSVDGIAIPASSWRVDNGKWLVRTDGECWPDCQNYDVDSGTGTFFVTYQQGLAVPSVVARAAGELACEWAKACLGQPCRLPQRVQSVTRQGVSVSMVPPELLLSNGLTGIETVDQIIRSINPYGLASRMRIASPDAPVTRYTTQA